jgi:hypothetical protein
LRPSRQQLYSRPPCPSLPPSATMASTEKDPLVIEKARSLANTPWCDDYEKMISGVLYVSFV